MNQTARNRRGRALVVVAAAALATACAAEAPLGTDGWSAARAGATAAGAAPGNGNRGAELGACQNLQVPAGSKLVFHVYAQGVQIYRWNGTTWVFQGPLATLSADAGGNSIVGIHYGGPTWESNSGSKVVGTMLQNCTPDPNAIAWLLLGAVRTEGPGIFERVSFIQRVNTVGGKAPSYSGTVTGEEARVPYTTEYFFYRTK